MPRVTHVKSARKNNPVAKKGESYYWWKFRYGGKRYSLTRPRPSQLTQSAYYGAVRAMVEQIEDTTISNFEEFESMRDEIRDQLSELSSETQDSLDNIPESLQYAPTGELLQERIDALDEAEGELDCIDEPEAEDFEREDYDREPFDEEPYAEDEREEAEADHAEDQDDLEAQHNDEQDDAEKDHKEQQAEEFSSWIEDATNQLVEAVANTEI